VPLHFRHGPEKHVGRFLGCLTVFANHKAVHSVAFEEDRRIVHPERTDGWRKIAFDRVVGYLITKDAQIHFRESEEVVCHFPRKVCNIDQLLEPRSQYSALSFNKWNTVMG
jgi:hypothetical protein